MRISNITEFAGGADDIVAIQIVQGSAQHWTITMTDSEQNPIDLTNYTYEFDTITSTGTITPGRGSAFTLTNLAVDDGATATSRDSLVSTTDATAGQLNVYLPADLYSGTVPFDDNTTSSIVVGTIRLNDGQAQPTIRTVRTIIVVRYGVIAP